MKNEDTTDIMDELAAMLPSNRLRSSIPESTLHRISKMAMKEVVEDKKMELMQLGTKSPTKDIDVLSLINTCELYRLINDGIDNTNLANIGLKSNNILGTHIVEE